MDHSESLKKTSDFRRVYRNGKSHANRYLVAYVLRNGLPRNRLGISASKKVGNSVVRHRLTRLVRESYRLNEDAFLTGIDIVVVVRPSARGISYREMEGALLNLGRLHKVLAS